MAKTKRLNVKQVEAELRLIACGAVSGPFVTDYGPFTTLLTMNLDCLSRFASAIVENYFENDDSDDLLFLRMTYCECWESYETLAAEIVKERKRLDAKGQP